MQLTKNLKVLKRKEIKPIIAKFKDHWGFEKDLDYVFLLKKEDEIYIMDKNISKLDLDRLRIKSIGLCLGKTKNNMIRLSIEGSQIIGPHATKNIVKIPEKIARLWIRGYDIPYDTEKGKLLEGLQIIKCGPDYMGCGIFKENRILNFIPKARRLNVEN